jgi:hypothetical protein
VRLEFDSSLNCIIGGRGTRKTTVLEVLRWALDHMPDPVTSSTLARSIDRLVQANLGSGLVEIETDSGLGYRVRRSYGGAAMVLSASGEALPIEIGRGTVFSAEVYSQSQIEEIANDPLFQLKLIDKFIAAEVKEIQGQIEAHVRDLRGNAAEILKARAEVTDLKEKVSAMIGFSCPTWSSR